MAVFPDFDTLKASILTKTKTAGVCDAYYQAVNATDFLSLIAAGCGYFAWLGTILLSSDELDTIPEEDLNRYAVYRLNATLTNPTPDQYDGCHGYFIETSAAPSIGQEIWFVRTSVFDVTLDGANITTVHAIGNAVGNITVGNGAQLNLFVYQNANVTITLNDNASACVQTKGTSVTTITLNGDSSQNSEVLGASTITVNGNDTSASVMRVYGKTNITANLMATATLEIIPFSNRYVFNSALV